MPDQISLSFEIENKRNIEEILEFSSLIPAKVLQVQKGTKYAKRLEGLGSKVSVALVAKADKCIGGPDYTIGYIGEATIVIKDSQRMPLMINHEMVQREKEEFRNNKFYSEYKIEVISPPMDMFEFFKGRDTLAPYATPNSIR
jgi:hypothetical protein